MTMKKLVIHIGLRKAGSTTIQKFLGENFHRLRQMGCDYPKVGRNGRWSHSNIAAEIKQSEQFDVSFGSAIELSHYIKSNQYPMTILSSEAFEPFSPNEIEKLKNILEDKFSETIIIIIIREPRSLIPSIYTESVLSGRWTPCFDEFFEGLFTISRLRYFATGRKWALAWGWRSIRVRLLDPNQMLNGDLLDDFMNTAGLDLSDRRYEALKRPGSANVSPGWRVVEAMRALFSDGHQLPVTHPLVADVRTPNDIRVMRACAVNVGTKMGWNAERGVYLTRAQAERSCQMFTEAVNRLNLRLATPIPPPFGPADADFKGRQFLPSPEQIEAAERRDFYDEVGAAYLTARGTKANAN